MSFAFQFAVAKRSISVTSHKQLGVCGFPGCDRPVTPSAGDKAGRPPRYCDLPAHNAQTAFRERRRLGDAGPDAEEQGDRPVSLAAMTLRSVAQRFGDDLDRALEALRVLTNTEQLDAELASVRADTHAEVSRAE
ncbi:MAG: hypothetical protein QOJ39_3180, partial [Candidatus Eremiobacteraeota bacterium]|nr:hypothetical protein [Candidatus Eremiobacteraeota bacterium]